MEKASKERQGLQTTTNPITIPIKTAITTTIALTEHQNKEEKEEEERVQQKLQTFQNVLHKFNSETTTCKNTGKIKIASRNAARSRRLYRKDNTKNNKNSKQYNHAFKFSNSNSNIQAETSAAILLPCFSSTSVISGYYETRNQQQKQQKSVEKTHQQLTLTKATSLKMTTNRTAAISLIYRRKHEQEFGFLGKCFSNNSTASTFLYNSNVIKSKNSFNCCTSYAFNTIKPNKKKASSKIQKLLQYTALRHSCSSSRSSNSGNSSTYGSNLDIRSFFYITLFILIYCTVLIRASATAAATESAALEEQLSKLSKQNPFQQKQQQQKQQISSSMSNAANLNLETSQHYVSSLNQSNFNVNLTLISGSLDTTDYAPMFYLNSSKSMHRLNRRNAANVPDDDDDSSYHDDEFDEYDALIKNKSAKGKYIGAPCNELKCESTLLHVTCDKETLTCGCERNYPVQLGLTKGCDKPKKLGEQCFYDETCMYNDENSLCVQVRHNALCQCASGYHSVSYTKPTRRVFCTQDLKELTSDLPTLLGVTTGIAVLAGLICMVLHLFSKTKYPRHRNFGDANIPPPIMYSSDTVQSGRPSSRSSLRSSGSIGSYGNRRSSSGGVIGGGGGSGSGSKGILVSTSRTGSRRPSLASVHSTSSSVRSYSMMRFEKETQQKEIRQEMKLRLARLQQQQQMSQNRPQIIIGDALTMLSGRSEHGGGASCSSTAMTAFSRLNMTTPSPLTPNSTDELLPAVDELQEYPLKSEMLPMTSTKQKASTTLVAAATLTSVQEIATTSTIALAAAAAAASSSSSSRNNATEKKGSESNILNVISDTAEVQKQFPPQSNQSISEAGAYIGPCSSSSEAL